MGGVDLEKLYQATLKRHCNGYFAFVTIFIFLIHKYLGLPGFAKPGSNRCFKNGQHMVGCSPDCVTFVKTPAGETCSAVILVPRSYLHVREDPAIMYEIFRGLKAYDFDARLSCLFTEQVDRSSRKDGDSAEQMARY